VSAAFDLDSGDSEQWPYDSGGYDAASYDAGALDAGFDGGPGALGVTVNLTTGAGVPPCASAGPAASGTAQIYSLGQPNQWIEISLAWQNLSSPVTAAHIHYGAAGTNGPVVLPFAQLVPPFSATFTAMEYLAAPGAPISFDAFESEFMAGKAYVNLHTQNCPDGELRGQIVWP
jgi:hypothetical protein